MKKAISIIQPHASLIAWGIKHIETRSWRTNYRGRILIHASKTRIPKAVRQNEELMSLIGDPNALPFGSLICEATLVDCLRIDQHLIEAIRDVCPTELACGYYSDGRYAWFLEDIVPIQHIPVKGHLGIWNYEEIEMKEKIKNKIEEISKLLSENNIYADIEQFLDLPVICINIRWGDWKHEHLRTKYLLKENVKGIEYFNTVVTAENGTDCYSAEHRYLVK